MPTSPPPHRVEIAPGIRFPPLWRRWFDTLHLTVDQSKTVVVAVADISNPALSALQGEVDGQLLITHNAGAWNTYTWDTDGGPVNSPFVVQGNGGVWIAGGPLYSNQPIYIPANQPVVIGDGLTDGDYRFVRAGDRLNIERRESGVWVKKGAFRP